MLPLITVVVILPLMWVKKYRKPLMDTIYMIN